MPNRKRKRQRNNRDPQLPPVVVGPDGWSNAQVAQLIREAGKGGAGAYKAVKAIRKAWVADQVARNISSSQRGAEQAWLT